MCEGKLVFVRRKFLTPVYRCDTCLTIYGLRERKGYLCDQVADSAYHRNAFAGGQSSYPRYHKDEVMPYSKPVKR